MSIWNKTSFEIPSFSALSTIETVALHSESTFSKDSTGITAYHLLRPSSPTFSYTVAGMFFEFTLIEIFFTPLQIMI